MRLSDLLGLPIHLLHTEVFYEGLERRNWRNISQKKSKSLLFLALFAGNL
jgi:hypothetical protein